MNLRREAEKSGRPLSRGCLAKCCWGSAKGKGHLLRRPQARRESTSSAFSRQSNRGSRRQSTRRQKISYPSLFFFHQETRYADGDGSFRPQQGSHPSPRARRGQNSRRNPERDNAVNWTNRDRRRTQERLQRKKRPNTTSLQLQLQLHPPGESWRPDGPSYLKGGWRGRGRKRRSARALLPLSLKHASLSPLSERGSPPDRPPFPPPGSQPHTSPGRLHGAGPQLRRSQHSSSRISPAASGQV